MSSTKNYKSKLIFWMIFLISLFLFFFPMQFYIVRVVSRHFGYADKIVHFLIFLLLAYFGRKAYGGVVGAENFQPLHSKNKKLLFLLAVYVITIELAQLFFISARSFEIADMFVGWAGIAAGWWIF